MGVREEQLQKEGKGGELLNVERKEKERKTNTVLKKELLLQLQQKIKTQKTIFIYALCCVSSSGLSSAC